MPLQIIRPSVPLQHVRPEEGEVVFWHKRREDARAFQPGEYCTIDEYAVRVVSGGLRRDEVVRARINGCCAVTSITKELADLLGLEYLELSGQGTSNMLRVGRSPVSILAEPLSIEVLDLAGRSVYTMTPQLVFVDHNSKVYDLQIGRDLVVAHRIIDDFGNRHKGIIVSRPNAAGGPEDDDVPVGGAPSLLPRRLRPGEPALSTSTFYVEQDTWEHAVQVAQARAAVRARRDTAAQA
ncbi:hypothetical protein GPECTOR_27g643 [Gonium pectorale]|uniref:Uncharacterized protein n=1 Tax=Gonium pectorale TaxID=33097 RepID=A0A150GFB5_GONPE|nr:hypothetical protein GPECTOR_27g643 [Gonium pectorale]|eukprot:KXZ48473.1 hypothetical protein GPECTOR_27g643 [Gonium pectorale]